MLSAVSAGFYAASRIKGRVSILESCIRLLQTLNADITYSAEPLRKVIGKACKNHEFDKLSFLKTIACSEDDDFTQLWKNSVKEYCQFSSLTGGDTALLISFGEKLGASDSEHQSRLCEEYISLLQCRYDSARKSMAERVKLYKACSIIGGFVMIILLM